MCPAHRLAAQPEAHTLPAGASSPSKRGWCFQTWQPSCGFFIWQVLPDLAAELWRGASELFDDVGQMGSHKASADAPEEEAAAEEPEEEKDAAALNEEFRKSGARVLQVLGGY